MTIHHFLIPSIEGDAVTLPPDSSHHAVRVLRIAAQDQISVTDGRGAFARGVLRDPDPRGSIVEIRERDTVPQPSPRLTVAFALTKSTKPELVVEKLTELGMDRIIPFSSDRSVVRWDEQKRMKQADRFRTVAVGALEQSKRCWLPEVEPLLDSLDQVLAAVQGDRLLMCDMDGEQVIGTASQATCLIVGPEGGFTDRERAVAAGAGATVVRLSDATLRAETAAISAAALAAASRLGAV